MKGISALELLEAWESCLGESALLRSQMLLSAAFPEISMETSDGMSLGELDDLLMRLRIDLFGPDLSAIASCPRCRERLDLNFSVPDTPDRTLVPGEEIHLHQGGYDIRFRLPNCKDLRNLSEMANSPANAPHERTRLLDLCLIEARHLGEKCSAEQLPGELIDAVSERMSEADTMSNNQLSLSCPSCHHMWQETLDIGSFLWAEIDSWALRTLREVHAISSCYGWSEADILALSPLRRRIYLEMVNG